MTNDQTRHTVGNFAVLDHVVTPFQYRTFFRSILSAPSLPLPWFHRHYLLTAKFIAPDFVQKDPPAAPPAFLPPSTSQKHAFQSLVLQYFQESSSLATPQVCSEPLLDSVSIYTDGSCPDQHNVGPYNPAGWGVYMDTSLFQFMVVTILANCKLFWKPCCLFLSYLTPCQLSQFTLTLLLGISSLVLPSLQPRPGATPLRTAL